MNRRGFLSLLGAGAAAAASKSFFFFGGIYRPRPSVVQRGNVIYCGGSHSDVVSIWLDHVDGFGRVYRVYGPPGVAVEPIESGNGRYVQFNISNCPASGQILA